MYNAGLAAGKASVTAVGSANYCAKAAWSENDGHSQGLNWATYVYFTIHFNSGSWSVNNISFKGTMDGWSSNAATDTLTVTKQ